MRVWTAVLLMMICGLASAEDRAEDIRDPVVDAIKNAPHAPVDGDVAELEGNVLGLKELLERCVHGFPDLAAANRSSYDAWRAKYKASLDLIERNWNALILRISHGDEALAAKVHDRLEQAILESVVKGEPFLEDPAQFESVCRIYPQRINLFNIDSRFAEQLAALRAHPIAEESKSAQPTSVKPSVGH